MPQNYSSSRLGAATAPILVSLGDEWKPLGNFRLQVVSATTSQQAELAPAIDFANKGQIAEGHRPSTDAEEIAILCAFSI